MHEPKVSNEPAEEIDYSLHFLREKVSAAANTHNSFASSTCSKAPIPYFDCTPNCCESIQSISNSLKCRHSDALSEQQRILERIQLIQAKISDTELSISRFKSETEVKQSKLLNDTKIMSEEKGKEIQRLHESIAYKEEITEFFKKLSSTEIVDFHQRIRFITRILKDSHEFVIENDEETGQLCYDVIGFTQNPDYLPEWLKSRIIFDKDHCPGLFLSILQYLSSNN